MPDQSATNVLAAVKREAAGTPGTAAAAGAGAAQIRLLDSPGLRLERGNITSGERRRDQMANMGRLGSKTVNGSYNAELTIGGVTDSFLEAVLRSVWSDVIWINLSATDGTTTTNTIVRATGSWLTDGFRVGDVVSVMSDNATPANNGLRLRATNVTATTITVAGNPLTANATAHAFSVTRLKKLTTPAVPTLYSYTVEQYDADIDMSELFLGCRVTNVSFSFRPNAIATITYTLMGMDRTILTVTTSPYFTGPSLTTGAPLVADDSAIRFNGADVARFTAMDLSIAVDAATQPVIGSLVSPDVFLNTATVSGSISVVRNDFARLQMFDKETEFELSALFTEPGVAPLPSFGVFLPRVKFGGLDAPFLGGDAGKVETLPLMVGVRAAAAGYDASAINFFSTAPL